MAKRKSPRTTSTSTKPLIVKVEKYVMRSDTGASMDYEEFVHSTDDEKVWDQKSLSPEAAVKILRDWGYEIPSHLDIEGEGMDALFDFVSDNKIAKGYNTYNDSWFGPTINFYGVQEPGGSGDPYEPELYFARMHHGGDVRGNYGSWEAFYVKHPAESAPWYAWSLGINLTTEDGQDIRLDSQDMEGYHFNIEDPTGTLSNSASFNDLKEAYDWAEGVDIW